MRIYAKMLWAGLLALGACTSASDDNDAPDAGEGTMTLMATFPTESDNQSSSDKELLASCTIFISNQQGRIRTYNGVGELPEKLWLPTGSYVAEAWAGDSVAASFDRKYYRGYQRFIISKGENVTVPLRCPLANVIVSVSYDEAIKDALKKYELKVAHTRGSLLFVGDENRKGYFMMPDQNVTDLNWVLTGENYDGKPFTKTGTLKNVKKATEYRLRFNYSGTPTLQGGAIFDLSVDMSEIDVYDDVELKGAPVIGVDGMDIAQTLVYHRGNSRRHPVTIVAPAGLSSVTMTSNQFERLGLDQTSYSLLSPTDATVQALYSKGINILTTHDDDGSDAMVVNFSAKLCNLLPVGDYVFDFAAVDAQQRETNASLKIKIVSPEDKD